MTVTLELPMFVSKATSTTQQPSQHLPSTELSISRSLPLRFLYSSISVTCTSASSLASTSEALSSGACTSQTYSHSPISKLYLHAPTHCGRIALDLHFAAFVVMAWSDCPEFPPKRALHQGCHYSQQQALLNSLLNSIIDIKNSIITVFIMTTSWSNKTNSFLNLPFAFK